MKASLLSLLLQLMLIKEWNVKRQICFSPTVVCFHWFEHLQSPLSLISREYHLLQLQYMDFAELTGPVHEVFPIFHVWFHTKWASPLLIYASKRSLMSELIDHTTHSCKVAQHLASNPPSGVLFLEMVDCNWFTCFLKFTDRAGLIPGGRWQQWARWPEYCPVEH